MGKVIAMTDANDLPALGDDSSPPEIVDLAEIDLDFGGDGQRHTDLSTVRAAGGVAWAQADATDLAKLELFRDVASTECATFAAQARIIQAAPGCVLQPAGQFSDKVFFVISGELRLYGDPKEKRPRGIVDTGQSIGLYWTLRQQPTEISIVATEPTQVLILELRQLEEFAQHSHAFACNYNALLTSYLRGDNCLVVGARTLAAWQQRRGYTDELTQLHNQRWLDEMLPRLLGRGQYDSAPLSVVMLAVDKLGNIERDYGSVAGEQILVAAAQLLLDASRTTDLLVCDGNRRFLAILPNTPRDSAHIFCQRVHEGMRLLRVGTLEDQPLPSLTFSSGIVQRDSVQSAADLLGRLEKLVQKSTENGGDRLGE